MTTKLDRSEEETVADILVETMEDLGYTPEEFIPGLLVAARTLAGQDEDVLIEATRILEEEE